MLNSIKRIAVILNPVAGRGQAGRRRYEVESYFSRAVRNIHNIVSWKIIETTGHGSATQIARDAVDSGVQVVVAAGGDGTLCEVLNGIVGSDVKLGLIPLGTGNDFARTIGVGLSIKNAVLSVFYGDPVKIDVGKIRDRYFINVAGCGFDALVAERINSGTGNLRGKAAYISAVLQTLKDFEPVDMKLTLDGETRTVRALLCAVANARSYGGGMKVAPDALLNDGVFDICLVSAGKWEFVKSFPKVFKGTHTTHPDVYMARAKTVCVETEKPIRVIVDGEQYGETPAEFTLLPQAITLLGPERQPGSDSEQYGYLDLK
jgi:diacylglycerol kinase (ATP)